jgi:hypothetical protein
VLSGSSFRLPGGPSQIPIPRRLFVRAMASSALPASVALDLDQLLRNRSWLLTTPVGPRSMLNGAPAPVNLPLRSSCFP